MSRRLMLSKRRGVERREMLVLGLGWRFWGNVFGDRIQYYLTRYE